MIDLRIRTAAVEFVLQQRSINMAIKKNIRSFRYSDEIADILADQQGENLNVKFENLVKTCFCELDRKQEELNRIESKIKEKRQMLCNLEKATAQLDMLERDIKNARFSFGIVERRAAAIAEKVETL